MQPFMKVIVRDRLMGDLAICCNLVSAAPESKPCSVPYNSNYTDYEEHVPGDGLVLPVGAA